MGSLSSIKRFNNMTEFLKSSTESASKIASPKYAIFEPKSAEIVEPRGSNNSPSTDTARYPCFAKRYAERAVFTKYVWPNRKTGNLTCSE